MFTIYENVIDTIQTGKKKVVDTFVLDAKFKTELNKLIDSQTEFAKGSVKSSVAIAEALFNHAQTNFKTFVPSFNK